MTTSPLPVRVGSQRPAFLLEPLGRVSSAGPDAVALAASAGLYLDDWQAFSLDVGLSERADGTWAAREVAEIVPRQNGKGSIAEALCLGGLYLFDDHALTIYTSHLFSTTRETFRRVDELIAGAPHLAEQVKRRTIAALELGFELHNGNRLRFMARTSGSGRGLSSGGRILLDEAYNLGAEMMDALVPTLSAKPNAQLWYLSSAGLPDSDVLRGVRDRGRSGVQGRLAYLEWTADRPDYVPDPYDMDGILRANPAYGARIFDEAIADEREMLGAAGFLRERLGIWDDPGRGIVRIQPAAWNALADRASKRVGPVVFGVDVSWDRSATSIAVAGAREDGLGHLEFVERRDGTAWVVDRCVQLDADHQNDGFVVQPGSPAATLIVPLQQAGLTVVEPSAREVGEACGGLFDAVSERSVRHLGQIEVDDGLSGAGSRTLGDLWLWDRQSSTSDISPLVALTLARWAWLEANGDDYDIRDSFL